MSEPENNKSKEKVRKYNRWGLGLSSYDNTPIFSNCRNQDEENFIIRRLLLKQEHRSKEDELSEMTKIKVTEKEYKERKKVACDSTLMKQLLKQKLGKKRSELGKKRSKIRE